MQPFSYERPASLESALQFGAAPRSAYFAGGTTLVDLMKLDVLTPATIVDINGLPFNGINVDAHMLYLGALTRMSDAADHADVRAQIPAVAQALDQSASGQLRNMASLGGNVLQRTRCAYYRDVASRCNKRRPNSGCGALDGISEEHAVLGTSDGCIAVHASDFAVPLVAFDAVFRVQSVGKKRSITAADLFVQPGATPERETSLEPGEMIVGIEIPRSSAARRSMYVKVRERQSYAFALAACAAGLSLNADGTIDDVRIALGGVGTVPWRAHAAEAALRGRPADSLRFVEAARLALAEARPTHQNAYKIELAVAAIVRALQTLTA